MPASGPSIRKLVRNFGPTICPHPPNPFRSPIPENMAGSTSPSSQRAEVCCVRHCSATKSSHSSLTTVRVQNLTSFRQAPIPPHLQPLPPTPGLAETIQNQSPAKNGILARYTELLPQGEGRDLTIRALLQLPCARCRGQSTSLSAGMDERRADHVWKRRGRHFRRISLTQDSVLPGQGVSANQQTAQIEETQRFFYNRSSNKPSG